MIAVVGFLEFFVSFAAALRFVAIISVDARAAFVVVVIVVTVILILIVAVAFLSAVVSIGDVSAKVDIFIYSYFLPNAKQILYALGAEYRVLPKITPV